MYTIYTEHIEMLEEENADLKKEVVFLKKIVEYYRNNTIDVNDAISEE
tara:strand:- start:373 stop:516 length:144 start_codon:yes stop_codon:yes gene_type:complete